jgi:hypothetical protein
MRNSISKATVALATALTILAVVTSSAAPATAGGFRMGGFGGGGFHSGSGGGLGRRMLEQWPRLRLLGQLPWPSLRERLFVTASRSTIENP